VRPDTNCVSFETAGLWLAPGVDNGFVSLGQMIDSATVCQSTSHFRGITINSGATNEGASAADCGKAVIWSDVW
jgi:hypothetical protein